MKKTLAMILVVVLCLSLCACGKAPTKEELLTQNPIDVPFNEFAENPVNAKEEYAGTVVTGYGVVREISTEYAIIYESNINAIADSTRQFRVNLPKDELKQLMMNMCVTFVGELEDVTGSGSMTAIVTGHLDRLTLINTFEVVGFGETGVNVDTFKSEKYCKVGNVPFLVFFEDDSVIETLNIGDTITFEANEMYNDAATNYREEIYFKNAKLVSAE